MVTDDAEHIVNTLAVGHERGRLARPAFFAQAFRRRSGHHRDLFGNKQEGLR